MQFWSLDNKKIHLEWVIKELELDVVNKTKELDKLQEQVIDYRKLMTEYEEKIKNNKDTVKNIDDNIKFRKELNEKERKAYYKDELDRMKSIKRLNDTITQLKNKVLLETQIEEYKSKSIKNLEKKEKLLDKKVKNLSSEIETLNNNLSSINDILKKREIKIMMNEEKLEQERKKIKQQNINLKQYKNNLMIYAKRHKLPPLDSNK